jgi:hypothetical protein
MKAWSQNLGHEAMMTTFTSYGTISGHRQADILNWLAENVGRPTADNGAPSSQIIDWVVNFLASRKPNPS